MKKYRKNINKFDIALSHISINLMSEISIKNSMNKKIINHGYIYTLYRKLDNSIKIGYAKNIDVKRGSIENEGYILNNSRKGSFKEIEYLKKTLKELGYEVEPKGDIFTLSNDLYKWLLKLDWPIILSNYK